MQLLITASLAHTQAKFLSAILGRSLSLQRAADYPSIAVYNKHERWTHHQVTAGTHTDIYAAPCSRNLEHNAWDAEHI